jgi:hypothetical protein
MRKALSIATIFLGSFLVFGVQPMVGRTLLPVFGGTAAVWVVCLCAFQILLLAGYFYAHVISQRTNRMGARVHLALLAFAAVLSAVVALKRTDIAASLSEGSVPALDVLLCVLALVGFAYVLLSANSSLVQAMSGGENVYRLYAVSNLGSLLGLVAYPFVFEPHVRLSAQWMGFAAGIAVYAVLLAFLARRGNGEAAAAAEPAPDFSEGTSDSTNCAQQWLWLLLPAASCFLLNALTTHITLDVMPMPLIWTGTLAIFLLSYIIGFSGQGEKLVRPLGVLSMLAIGAVAWTNGKNMAKITLPTALALFGALLLFACTFLHSWLYAIRPRADRLTKYYLFQSIGGALGGTLAALAFPLVCDQVTEYPISLVVVGAAVVVCFAARRRWVCLGASGLAGVAALVLWIVGAQVETRPVVYRGRGFFGTIEVLEAKARTATGEGRIHEFVHGTTIHGIQVLIPGKERMPTTYYTPDSSGFAIAAHPKYRRGEPMRVNITGLGVGVLFCYGREGDYYRAYEISPDALAVANDTNLFTFVSGCLAKKEIVLGDARKGLEAELAAGVEPYDVIVVDAFTGDNLPYHLSTREAFELYFKLLKPDGILCVNISNWHINLLPFMKSVGDAFACPLLALRTGNDYANLRFAATVAFFCRDPSGLGPLPPGAKVIDFNSVRGMDALPTDEKGSFISLVNW